MAIFNYTAIRNGAAKIERSKIEAENEAEAYKKLRNLGLQPLRIKVSKTGFRSSSKTHRVPLKEKIIFTRQMAVMVKAGLPLVNSLAALARQTENKYFKNVIEDIASNVQGGQPLSKALEKYPRVFSEVYISVIRAGESTGQLANVLFNLADQQEKEAELIAKVKGAMIYPAVILTALIGVVVIVIFFVLPSLQSIFADLGGELPLATRVLFAVSQFARGFWWIILPAIAGLFYLIHWWFARPSGRPVYDTLKIKMPIFGNLTKKVYMARFSRTMAMLVQASLPILQAIDIVKDTIANTHYQQAFDRIHKEVESGKSIAKAIEKEALFPPIVVELVTLGEESGNLETDLLEIARFYDSEVDQITKNLSTLIEPVMLIIMGIGVAFVVASVLTPIYRLVEQF